MVANGIVVDIKTGKPVNEKPEGENTAEKEVTKSTKKDKK